MKKNIVPKTLGIILDGNGRWAEKNGLHRIEGHTAGIVNLVKITDEAFDLGVETVVLYGLSTENLFRERVEVEHIYKLVIEAFDLFVKTFSKRRACVRYIGNTSRIPDPVLKSMKRAEEALKPFENCGRTIYIGIAYGSRHEIVSAINSLVERGMKTTEQDFLSELSAPVEPELIIRTGGEKRLSNFMLYQCSYSELYFSNKLFPEFDRSDLEKAFRWFSRRERRYGLIKKK